MASTGFTFVASGSSGTPGGGTTAWGSTGNLTSNNNADATCALIIVSGSVDSQTLRGFNLGFSNDLTANAQIDGVQWRYERSKAAGPTGTLIELDERQINSGAYIGTDQANSGSWATGRVLVTYGGSTNLMGAGLTAAIVRGSGYGFGVRVRLSGASKQSTTARVDYMQCNVFFTEPPAAPSSVVATQDGEDVDITWTDNATDENNYEVRVSVNGGGFSILSSVIAANSTLYVDTTGYSDGDTLDYEVRALKTSGPDSAYVAATQIEYEAGQTVTIGLATETDSGLSLSGSKDLAIGLSTETDTALGVTGDRQLAIGSASETDTAFDVAAAFVLEIGLSVETDTAVAVGSSRSATTGLVEETDTALSLTAEKTNSIGLALETDSAFTIVIDKLIEIGLVTETDTAFAIAAGRQLSIGLSLENDSALAIERLKVLGIALATETDIALDAAFVRRLEIGLASETDSALSLGATKRAVIGLANELDIAISISQGPQSRVIDLASETDAAQSIDAVKSRVIGLATASEQAFALIASKFQALGLAVETDTALNANANRVQTIGLSTETDQAFALAASKLITLGIATETDIALALQIDILLQGDIEFAAAFQRIITLLAQHSTIVPMSAGYATTRALDGSGSPRDF